jgi:hypothetical protein
VETALRLNARRVRFAYMSREQARGKPVDKRTDIWAFGCVLFEMLAGRPAFSGDTLTDIVAAVMKNEPDWSALPIDVPAPVRSVLRRCLKKDPGRRLHDIADARIELDEPEAAVPGTRAAKWLRILPSAVTAARAMAVLVFAMSAREEPGASRDVIRTEIGLAAGASRRRNNADTRWPVSPCCSSRNSRCRIESRSDKRDTPKRLIKSRLHSHTLRRAVVDLTICLPRRFVLSDSSRLSKGDTVWPQDGSSILGG